MAPGSVGSNLPSGTVSSAMAEGPEATTGAGQAVALVEGGEDEQVGGLVGRDEGRVVHVAGQAEAVQDAEPPGEPNDERALLRTHAECDDELVAGTQLARQERVGPEQALDVL